MSKLVKYTVQLNNGNLENNNLQLIEKFAANTHTVTL